MLDLVQLVNLHNQVVIEVDQSTAARLNPETWKTPQELEVLRSSKPKTSSVRARKTRKQS